MNEVTNMLNTLSNIVVHFLLSVSTVNTASK